MKIFSNLKKKTLQFLCFWIFQTRYTQYALMVPPLKCPFTWTSDSGCHLTLLFFTLPITQGIKVQDSTKWQMKQRVQRGLGWRRKWGTHTMYLEIYLPVQLRRCRTWGWWPLFAAGLWTELLTLTKLLSWFVLRDWRFWIAFPRPSVV